MKARKLLLVIATIALLGTAVCAKDYKDVPDTHWAREQIAYLSDEIAGYPDGTFRPESTVTRAEFVTLLARTVFPEELKNETGDLQREKQEILRDSPAFLLYSAS